MVEKLFLFFAICIYLDFFMIKYFFIFFLTLYKRARKILKSYVSLVIQFSMLKIRSLV